VASTDGCGNEKQQEGEEDEEEKKKRKKIDLQKDQEPALPAVSLRKDRT
jgi:hypothetical protein